MEDEQQAALHSLEKKAMVGDRDAVLKIISAFRRVRQASTTLLNSRHSDGECESVDITSFSLEVRDAIDEIL